eukprot:4739934-Amphidinium_carterae.1
MANAAESPPCARLHSLLLVPPQQRRRCGVGQYTDTGEKVRLAMTGFPQAATAEFLAVVWALEDCP